VLEEPEKYELNVNKGTLSKLATFRAMMEDFVAYARQKDAHEAAMEIIRRSGISAEINGDTSVEGKSRKENVEELINGISEFVSSCEEEGDEDNKLQDFLAEVSLMSDLESEEDDGGNDKITLMTIHSAKGLEFNTVFIVGVEENLLPSSMAQGSSRELEEERRLFYVAITRAKAHCMLTFAKSRYRYGSFEFSEPSRFLKEIDRAYIRMAGGSVGLGTQPSSGTPTFALTNKTRTAPAAPVEQRRIVPPQRLQRITPSAPVSPASSASSVGNPLRVGVLIEHDRFGVGEVVNVEGSGDNAKATIKFRNVGTKQLLLKFARYKIIG
jgi:DNA helicase-2/ATP-dependent DNA helicase PcrA